LALSNDNITANFNHNEANSSPFSSKLIKSMNSDASKMKKLSPTYMPFPQFDSITVGKLVKATPQLKKLKGEELQKQLKMLFSEIEYNIISQLTHIVLFVSDSTGNDITTLYRFFKQFFPQLHFVNMDWLLESTKAGGPLAETFFALTDFMSVSFTKEGKK
jgi:hypothetical protein